MLLRLEADPRVDHPLGLVAQPPLHLQALCVEVVPHAEAPAREHVGQEGAPKHDEEEEDARPLRQGAALDRLEVMHHAQNLLVDRPVHMLVAALKSSSWMGSPARYGSREADASATHARANTNLCVTILWKWLSPPLPHEVLPE
eukprot:CAMPEP_0173389722 /NCGR_PEP_ID=MMETSP1356-20130122/13230_1 /TAXON_ID=77927 ORGANISM="Hemiselmis virescens, Strain PCC157" /NCGR_SAMPLE_ID=MMETSP1356 /ASSEMBLY_ACC=CAM_ASM_000847 /LENGTH=143 /DNA_ID=CAMNT_0014346955 /DNA_START=258 /DNA_END=687 /DNA_ORIENTATION=+